MLVRYYVVAPCLSVCMCLSVRSLCSTKATEWNELIFGVASFDASYTVLTYKEIRVTPKIMVLPREYVERVVVKNYT